VYFTQLIFINLERVGDRQRKMERYCLTGQSPQRAVALTEEEEDFYQLVYRLTEDGGVPPKHVGVNKSLYCCLC
jgi:hypothetical protein